MATIHISELDAVRDFAGLIAKVRVGVDVAIESDGAVIAVVSAPEAEFRVSRLSEAIAEERRLEAEGITSPAMDAEFAEDLADVVGGRKSWAPPSWD
jgi:antitoxin (DNA-binding transcriptional repressor) of toxin-antitoxin stability system